jgi:hypothetical protein
MMPVRMVLGVVRREARQAGGSGQAAQKSWAAIAAHTDAWPEATAEPKNWQLISRILM